YISIDFEPSTHVHHPFLRYFLIQTATVPLSSIISNLYPGTLRSTYPATYRLNNALLPFANHV
ncbi:hypothetical protein, partial [Paraliobacillus ryukyuensis]|uniref:hypothetical protein n=1 Tax=Paraliobacillus ryukyuensis TaxID=200904 RepID=UPI001B885471